MEKQLIPQLRFPKFNGAWNISNLNNLTDIYDGTHQTPEYVNQGIPFVSVESIGDITNAKKFVTKEAFEKDYKIKPRIGDILMTRITAGIIGNTAIITNNNPLAYYVSLALIRRKNEELTVGYLNHSINSVQFKKELHRRIIHIAFPKKINLGEIGLCKISYPTLPEQQKIAAFLTDIDDKITKLTKKKELLEQYKKGIMQKIFNQELRFKDENGNAFPKWVEKKLGEVAIKQSSNISANTIEDNVGEYKIYGASGLLKKIDFYREEEPYVSIVKDGAGVGRTLLCDAYSSVLGTLDIIKPKKGVNLYFIYCLLNNLNFLKFITGSTIPHIYFKDYSTVKIKIPSLAEQTKIANFLSDIDLKIEALNTKIENSKSFKKGLLQKMFV
ncbi:MAG: restriction endonuclease subunit S [Winogradskyella arenosi]